MRVWTLYLELTAFYHPHLTLSLVRYQSTIVRMSSRFTDSAWLRYDSFFRQKIAQHPRLKWDSEDDRLYSEILKGHERSIPSTLLKRTSAQCYFCKSEGHIYHNCPQRSGQRQSRGVCFKWNSVGCSLPNCSFTHSCSHCGEGHPRLRCYSLPRS